MFTQWYITEQLKPVNHSDHAKIWMNLRIKTLQEKIYVNPFDKVKTTKIKICSRNSCRFNGTV